ncbi:MAG TPA: hypothetical protein VHM91_06490, partial [Verrucomicrobiales bacterium]|nr:hypothetical protein [Verrucomicrobiales bacterium]
TAVKTLVGRWLQYDPKAASEWVRGCESGPVRKAGGTAIIDYLKSTGETASLAEWEQWLGKTEK